MKALSIKQPYSSLIVEGIKDIENRSFKTNFRGRVYIHASAQWHDRLKTDSLFTKEQWEDIHKNNLDKNIDLNLYRYIQKDVTDKLIVSAIIGEVEIVDCVINHDSIWAEKTEGVMVGNQFIHNDKPIYNWVLANPVLYKKPILNVKGKLSFWEFRNLIECKSCTANETNTEMRFCEICEIEFCEDCQASFNQFSQIDYNCCQDCANRDDIE